MKFAVCVLSLLLEVVSGSSSFQHFQQKHKSEGLLSQTSSSSSNVNVDNGDNAALLLKEQQKKTKEERQEKKRFLQDVVRPHHQRRRELQNGVDCPLDTATTITHTGAMTKIVGSTVGIAPSLLPSDGSVDDCSISIEPRDGSGTLWYLLITDVDSPIAITTCSPITNFDTVINVYEANDDSGTGCNPTCLTSNDNDPGVLVCDEAISNTKSYATILSSPPVSTYYIAVSGFDDRDEGIFELTIFTFDDDETDNECPYGYAAPIVDFDVSAGPIKITGSTVDGPTNLPNAPGCDNTNYGSTVAWYSFELREETSLSFSTCSPNTNFDTSIHVYQGYNSDLCNGICVGKNDDHGGDASCDLGAENNELSPLLSTVSFSNLKAGIYYVAVSGYVEPILGFCEGTFELTIAAPEAMPCVLDNAIAIDYEAGGDVSLFGTTVGALRPSLQDTNLCGMVRGSPTVWYTFTASEFETIRISTCSAVTTFDTKIALYQDDPTAAGLCKPFCLRGNDDDFSCSAGITTSSSIEFDATSGAKYYVAVSGFSANTSGDYELTVTSIASNETPAPGTAETLPPNSTIPCVLEDAILIDYVPGGDVSVTGDTQGAPRPSLPDGADLCNLRPGASTVWYTFQSGEAETIIVTTCSDYTDYDTKISLFQAEEGDGTCNPICLQNNDDDFECSILTYTSTIQFEAEAATTYYVAVSGFSAQNAGRYELTVAAVILPTPSPVVQSTPSPVIPDEPTTASPSIITTTEAPIAMDPTETPVDNPTDASKSPTGPPIEETGPTGAPVEPEPVPTDAPTGSPSSASNFRCCHNMLAICAASAAAVILIQFSF